jgi:membrane protein YqaA with SNARE-associated domain
VNRRAIMSLAAVVLVATISGVVLWNWTQNPESVEKYGLFGIGLVSMVSHLTVVARDMFIPLYLPLASIYNPLVMGTFAGVGAAIGEVTTYILGWGVAESIEDENDQRISDWLNKYGLWAVLLVALTPLPDTPIVLLAGSNKLPFWKLFTVECVGKTILYSTGAVVGGWIFQGLSGAVGGFWTSVLMVVGSLAFCIAVTWKPSRDYIFGWVEKIF